MYKSCKYQKDVVRAEVSCIDETMEVAEYNAVFHVEDAQLTYREQLTAINAALSSLLSDIPNSICVFRRYFLSDAANQSEMLMNEVSSINGAVSVVEQPPLDGTKVALWAYILTNVEVRKDKAGFVVSHGGYSHVWTSNLYMKERDSYQQTEKILDKYAADLSERGLSLENDCIRTWFFVQNVDVNYMGVVNARREVFEQHDLLPDTHYITSTGIGGRDADPQVLVKMDAYAIEGLQAGQQQFLYALDYLNPTYEYGVTFERGVAVSYGDRKHLFLSGTASIDNEGQVMYEGDVRRQTERMWLNCDKLYAEGGASIDADVQVMIVYLRDIADYQVVSQLYEKRFPQVPKVILLAPVCRPGWLIEMESIASVKNKSQWKSF